MTRPGCMACTTEKPKQPTLATPDTKAATAAGKATAAAKGGAAAKKEAEPKAGGSGAAKTEADKKKQVIFTFQYGFEIGLNPLD